jgi:PhnB protein
LTYSRKPSKPLELRRFDAPDGRIKHAELRIDDTVGMIAEEGGNYPAFPGWLHVYVQDVDASYRKDLEAGGISVQEPLRKEGDPDRPGGFKDPSGNTWWLSTQREIRD